MAPTVTGQESKPSRRRDSFEEDAEQVQGNLSVRHKSVLLHFVYYMADYGGFGSRIMKRIEITEATVRKIADSDETGDGKGTREEARVVCELAVENGMFFLDRNPGFF